MPQLRFVSSRGGAPPVSLSHAMAQGLAPDGGLYVPTHMPRVDAAEIAPRARRCPKSRATVLRDFFAGDGLQTQLGEIADCRAEFSSADDGGARAPAILCSFWSSITARLRHSRTSGRDFWRSASSGCSRPLLRAAADHFGRHFRRHRRRGRRRFLSA